MTMRVPLLLFLMIISPVLAAPAAGDVLVFGGTGQLGARIVRLLLDADEKVTVFARSTSDRSRLDGLEVDYAVGDMLNERDVAAAFASGDIRVVVIAVRAPLSEAGFYATISRNVAAHAKAAGVGQIIYHGAVGAGDNMAQHPDVPWASVPGLVDRMEDQGAAEAIFLASGVATTIIRNSRVWPDEAPGTGEAVLTEDHGTLTPMTRADLARLTMQCLDNANCTDKVYHVRDDTLDWPPPQDEENVSAARRAELDNLLRQDCGSCHGLTRQGGLGKPLTADALATRSDEYLFAVISNGVAGTPMAPWGQLLSDEDIVTIVGMLRQP
jgi:cytochrome c55X